MALRLPGNRSFKPLRGKPRRPPLAATQPAPGTSQPPASQPPKAASQPQASKPAAQAPAGNREYTTKWHGEGEEPSAPESDDKADDKAGPSGDVKSADEGPAPKAAPPAAKAAPSAPAPTVVKEPLFMSSEAEAPPPVEAPPSVTAPRPVQAEVEPPSIADEPPAVVAAPSVAAPAAAAPAAASREETPTRPTRTPTPRGQPARPTYSSPAPGGKKGAKPLLAAVAVAGATSTPFKHGKSRMLRAPLPAKPKAAGEETPAATPEPDTPATPADEVPPSVAPADEELPPSLPPPVQDTLSVPPSVQAETQSSTRSASAILDATPAVVSSAPPAVIAVPGDDGPPAVGATAAAAGSSADPAALAAALVATITPAAEPIPTEVVNTNPRARKRRGGPGTRAARTSNVDTEEDDDAPALRKRGRPRKSTTQDDNSGSETPGSAKKRKAAPRRPATRSAPRLENPELDGVDVDGRVGGEGDISALPLSELAMVSRGRVSARTIKLHQFQRAEEERKAKERVKRAEENWKKRQIIRRKAREIKNGKRAERREAARERGEDPDEVVSDDSVDSEVEYEIEPERMTPPSSPSYFGKATRIAPVVFDAEQRAAMEAKEAESGSGNRRASRRHDDDEEDIEGLGLNRPTYDDDDPMEEHEELGDDFQLEIEEDPQPEGEFAGLESSEYIGGHFDDEGNWIEGGGADAGAVLQRRNEETRRRILQGEDDRQVEIVDNDTQFINSSTWGKKVTNERWTPEETELFFSVLRETGENYTLMKAYFPGRNVRQLRKKGQRENKMNPQRMNDAVMNRKPIDYQYLAKAAGYNNDEPYDKEVQFLKDLREERERQNAEDREAALNLALDEQGEPEFVNAGNELEDEELQAMDDEEE